MELLKITIKERFWLNEIATCLLKLITSCSFRRFI